MGATERSGRVGVLPRSDVSAHRDVLSLKAAVPVEVDDVKTLYLELRERDAKLHQQLRQEPWGQRTFIVVDPDGNLLSFGSHMTAPNQTEGSR